jgi:hypothetical protein
MSALDIPGMREIELAALAAVAAPVGPEGAQT